MLFYIWVTIPLAIHGVVIRKNGEKIPVVIGEDENLDLLVGSIPLEDTEKDAVKAKYKEYLENQIRL